MQCLGLVVVVQRHVPGCRQRQLEFLKSVHRQRSMMILSRVSDRFGVFQNLRWPTVVGHRGHPCTISSYSRVDIDMTCSSICVRNNNPSTADPLNVEAEAQ